MRRKHDNKPQVIKEVIINDRLHQIIVAERLGFEIYVPVIFTEDGHADKSSVFFSEYAALKWILNQAYAKEFVRDIAVTKKTGIKRQGAAAFGQLPDGKG